MSSANRRSRRAVAAKLADRFRSNIADTSVEGVTQQLHEMLVMAERAWVEGLMRSQDAGAVNKAGQMVFEVLARVAARALITRNDQVGCLQGLHQGIMDGMLLYCDDIETKMNRPMDEVRVQLIKAGATLPAGRKQ